VCAETCRRGLISCIYDIFVCASCWLYEITEFACYNAITSGELGGGMGRKHSPLTDRDANSRYKPGLLISGPHRVQCFFFF
jgi:hypothetical protein